MRIKQFGRQYTYLSSACLKLELDVLPPELGALVWISEGLPLDSELIVRVEPDGPDETWADLVTTLLYKLPEEENSLHGYGCSIELV